jgi:hypothetical protein
MVTLPALTPATRPFEFTVAIPFELEDQAPLEAGAPLPSKSIVEPIQTEVAGAVIVGAELTVTITSSVFEQPFPSVPVTV